MNLLTSRIFYFIERHTDPVFLLLMNLIDAFDMALTKTLPPLLTKHY